MDCPSCGKAMQLIQSVNVEARFADTELEGGEVVETIEVDGQRNAKYWECKPCKVSRPDE